MFIYMPSHCRAGTAQLEPVETLSYCQRLKSGPESGLFVQSWLDAGLLTRRERFSESKKCSRDTYPESYVAE